MIGVMEFLVILMTLAPALIFWIVVIILAAVMLRRGGGRAERFMITGVSLKIIGNLLSIFAVIIVPWLTDKGYSPADTGSIISGYSIFLNVISMAGIICLVYAFWVKFKERNLEGEVLSP